MLNRFDKNMLINADSKNGLNLIEGLVTYDLIFMNTSTTSKSNLKEKWLEIIQENLLKAKELVSSDGAIAVYIENKEYSLLKEVLDKLFGQSSYLNTFLIKNSTNNSFDFLLTYKKSNQFYYRNANKELPVNLKDGFWSSFKTLGNNTKMMYPIDNIVIKNGEWKWDRERGLRAFKNYNEYQEEFARDYTLKGYWNMFKQIYLNETGKELEFVRRNEDKIQYWVKPSEALLKDSSIMNSFVKEHLSKDRRFNTIKDIIDIFTDKNSKILEINALSGITVEAILTLNAEDGGSRYFTLMTNDNQLICSNVCKPEIDKIIEKYDENYQYFVVN